MPLAARVRHETGIATSAVGLIGDGPQAEIVLASGAADAVFVGRGWLRDPHFALRAAHELGEDRSLWPPQYQRALL